jgi:hypothetical protein
VKDPYALLQHQELVVRLLERSTGLPTSEAIEWATGEFLTPLVRDIYPRRNWAGMLGAYLDLHFMQYGLESPPSVRTVRGVLTKRKESTIPST